MKTIVYMRISKEEQEISLQKEAILKFLQYKGISDYVIYQDEGYTGSNKKRPGFKSMLLALNEPNIASLVVWKLDRLSRSLYDLVGLIRSLDEKNIAFMSVTENLDMSTPIGKMMIHTLAMFAEFERNVLIERTNAGIKSAKAKGIHCGRKSTVPNNIALQARLLLNRTKFTINEISSMTGLTRGKIVYIQKVSKSSTV